MLKTKFAEKYDSLSPFEKNILTMLEENIENIDNFSITHVASYTFSSTTSVNRLVKKLGLTYADFKYLLLKMQEDFKNCNAQINVPNTNNFDLFYQDITLETNKIAKDILSSNKIYIIGVGQSKYICAYLDALLYKLNLNNHILNDHDVIERLYKNIKKEDFIIYISSSGNTKTLVDAAKMINIHHHHSLLVSSNESAILRKYTKYALIGKSQSISCDSLEFSLQSSLMVIADELIKSIILMS